MDAFALFDVTNCIATALNAVICDQKDLAEKAWLEASLACGDAFPLNSDESEALDVILRAIKPMVTARAA